jgi:uncharacterized membrane protein YfcA
LLLELVVITTGSFVASFVNAAFATGGIYILLASSTSVLPLTAAVPLQTVFALGSLLARIGLFFTHIKWPIVAAFTLGAIVGVYFGIDVFVSLSESTIAVALGGLLLVLSWFPQVNWRIPLKHPFFFVGTIHAFLSTLFGVGTLLQPAILRTDLVKLQITGTLAASLAILDVFKVTGYVSHGFDYTPYIPHIVLATFAGFAGTWAGRRVTHHVSETAFRLVFRGLITLVAVRLLYRGWSLHQ